MKMSAVWPLLLVLCFGVWIEAYHVRIHSSCQADCCSGLRQAED